VGSPLDQAIEIVRSAEAEVADLLAEAAQERRYGDLIELTKIARSLAAISPELRSGADPPASLDGNREREEDRARHPRRPSAEYPLFLRDDDWLVKVGKSRTGSETYEHKAPLQVLQAVVRRALAVSSRSTRPFRTDALTSVKQHDDDVDIRGYQLYLCLGWLKRIGLLKQHGRKGYSIVAGNTIGDDVQMHWQLLPTRSEIQEATE
jgi:hypothetical protein